MVCNWTYVLMRLECLLNWKASPHHRSFGKCSQSLIFHQFIDLFTSSFHPLLPIFHLCARNPGIFFDIHASTFARNIHLLKAIIINIILLLQYFYERSLYHSGIECTWRASLRLPPIWCFILVTPLQDY